MQFYFCPNRSKPTLLTHLRLLLSQHLQQLLRLLLPQLLLRRRRRKSLRNRMTTWASVCLTKIQQTEQ